MAAVTVNTKKFNVSGSLRDQHYNVTGNTGDTLTVSLKSVLKVTADPAITSTSVAAGTVLGTSIITLNGTIAAANVQVIGN
jgi:hypothetical protein